MDDKVHEGIKVHERKENDDDSMWQPRCNIIDKESHPTCLNKAHWCAHPSHLGFHWLVLWYCAKNFVNRLNLSISLWIIDSKVGMFQD
jgi:hypothetical protein